MVILNINFPEFPFIYRYIKRDYEKVKSLEDMIELCFKWIDISETTKNKVKKKAYNASASVLYSEITKYSYCTNKFSQN